MQVLFAPWRMAYIGSTKEPGCIFCDQPHAEDRELAGRGDTGKPLFGGVSKAGTPLLRPPGA